MCLDFFQRNSLLRIQHQQSLDQISRFRAQIWRNRHIAFGNSSLCHDRCVLERRFSNQELVCQHAQRPQVNFLRVPVLLASGLDHLWRQVVQGSAHGVAAIVGRVHAPAKIADFDLAVDADQNVLGLDVAVHDVLLMQVLERAGHLRDVLRGLPFRELAGFAQVLVQLSFAGELEDEEDALAVVEVAVQAQAVRVRQVRLDFDFAAHLLLDFSLLQFGFVQDFQCADEAGGALAGEVDAAEFAFS